MNNVLTVNEFTSLNHKLGIVVKYYEGNDIVHCGILYRYKEPNNSDINRLGIVHQMNAEEGLGAQDNTDGFSHSVIVNLIDIDTIYQDQLISLCRVLSNDPEKRRIPYALYHNGDSTFDINNGNLNLGNNERGLTCATFIMTAFRSCGINLIDIDSWKEYEENIGLIKKMIVYLKILYHRYKLITQKFFDDEIKNINPNCKLFRPEDVAMSGTFEDKPGGSDEIREKGNSLSKMFRN